MGGRGFESRQKRPKLKDENFSILGDASFSHKKSIPDQKGARSSASISRVCPGRVGADPGTHRYVGPAGKEWFCPLPPICHNISLFLLQVMGPVPSACWCV